MFFADFTGLAGTAADLNMAEDTGFEPADPEGSTVFKTAAFDHSANPPQEYLIV